MIVQNTSGGIDDWLSQILRQRNQTQTDKTSSAANIVAVPKKAKTEDVIIISGQKPDKNNDKDQSQPKQNNSNLVSEKVKDTENGFRRTQEFENPNGLKFTRIEEITTTTDRSKRIVIQQNDSGSTTALESVVDRQDDGSFRLIQRYTDETGSTSSNVKLNFSPENADILLGRTPNPATDNKNPFQSLRGTQIDLSA